MIDHSINSRKNFFQRTHNKYDENTLVRSFLSVLELFPKEKVLEIIKEIFTENRNAELSGCTEIEDFYVFDHLWDVPGVKFDGIPDFGIMLTTKNLGIISLYFEAKRGQNLITYEQIDKYVKKIAEKERSFLVALPEKMEHPEILKELKKNNPNKILSINWKALFSKIKILSSDFDEKVKFLFEELYEFKEFKDVPTQVVFGDIFKWELRRFIKAKHNNWKKESKKDNKKNVIRKGNVFDCSIRGFCQKLANKIAMGGEIKVSKVYAKEHRPPHFYKAGFDIELNDSVINKIKFQFNIHSGTREQLKEISQIKWKFCFYIYSNKRLSKNSPAIEELSNTLSNNLIYPKIIDQQGTLLIYFEEENIEWGNPPKMLNDYLLLWYRLIDITKTKIT